MAGLHAVVEGAGPRIVLVHGFTQTQACWGPLATDLAADHQVCRVDAPGHGGSADVRADLPTGAGLVGDVGGPATYIGYSMGGRLLLHLALARPEVVRGLVLISATAGIDDPEERAARRGADDELAAEVEREGLEAFVDSWLARPMFAGLGPEAQCRTERLGNTAEGLASSLRLAGTGTQVPLWDALGTLEAPVLVVAGELDPRFAALGRRLADAIGAGAELEVVGRAGHTAHLEQPDAVLARLRRWLAAHDL